MTEDVTPEHYQTLIIPEIAKVYLHRLRTNYNFQASLEYKVSFFDQDHKMVFKTSAHGSGYDNRSKAIALGFLTLGFGGIAFETASLAKGFGEAEAQAMSKLIDNIISSPELLAYADGIKERIVEYKPEKEVQQVAASKYPPKLICKVSFSEPSGNYLLDAEEEGKLLVTIENKGRGNANLIQIDLNTIEPVKGLSYNKRLFIKTIPLIKLFPLPYLMQLVIQENLFMIMIKEFY